MSTLKETLDNIWNRPGIINPSHINWWNSNHGILEADGLFVSRGKKTILNIKYYVKFKKTPSWLCKLYGVAHRTKFISLE